MATTKQIGMIHGLAKRAGLDDDAYRGELVRTAGVTSAKDLSTAAAGRVIDRLQVLAGGASNRGAPRPAAAGALRLDGPFVGKLRALWLTAWNLGLIADRTDRALAAFVARQTGIDSPSWVADPKDARAAIEGLKKWIVRESGLEWPDRKDQADLRQLKLRLVRRQWEILIELGQEIRLSKWSDLADYAAEMQRRRDGLHQRPTVSETLGELDMPELDALAAALGSRIRKLMGTKR